MENKEPAIKIGDTWVFTGEWMMQQMKAQMDAYASLNQRLVLCYVLTAVSLLLSLVAIVIAGM